MKQHVNQDNRNLQLTHVGSGRLNHATSMRVWHMVAAATMIASASCVALASESVSVTARLSTPKQFAAGIDVRTQPGAEETGLPLYPGATVERSERDARGKEELNDGVNFDLWFGGYGLKLVVVKLKTDDSAEKVSAFYRNALTKYGEILDCSGASRETKRRSERRKNSEKSSKLTCDDFETSKSDRRDGEFYKSGVKQKQYGVAIQAKGDGATFQLLHFEKRGGDN
jgi:hypothetical protein